MPDASRVFLIEQQPGFTPQVGHLVAMMGCMRAVTLRAVDGLSVAELDHLHDEQSNTIGALLAHMAAVETVYQARTFEGRRLEPEEWQRLAAALELGDAARRDIHGHSLEHFVTTLDEVRSRTLAELARRTDEWLYESSEWWGGLPANNYFKWFHVLEDEIGHRGQIRWLRKRLAEPMIFQTHV